MNYRLCERVWRNLGTSSWIRLSRYWELISLKLTIILVKQPLISLRDYLRKVPVSNELPRSRFLSLWEEFSWVVQSGLFSVKGTIFLRLYGMKWNVSKPSCWRHDKDCYFFADCVWLRINMSECFIHRQITKRSKWKYHSKTSKKNQ